MLVRRCFGPLSLGLALSLAACTASMGDGKEDEGGSGGNGGKGSAGKGGSSSAGSGGTNSAGKDPGTVALHRLSKVEYNNTVRDLLGTKLAPADEFGFDDVLSDGKAGFGNNANSLTLGPTEMTYYQAAAEKLANEAVTAKPTAIWSCQTSSGEACEKTIVGNLAKRAFRRPVPDAEVTKLLTLVKLAKDNGDTADVGIGLAIQAMLTSPSFLYRVEIDPEVDSDKAHAITSWEMASRLSYFIWATMPDQTLFQAAEADKLKTVDEVGSQVDRMLKDGKAQEGLVANFGDYWTKNTKFITHDTDKTKFPSYDTLKPAMLDETRMLLKDLFTGALSFDKFMYGDYTYANDALATHYGITKPGSTSLTKVKVTDANNRGSFLTNASMLTATSQDAVTSVVQRGTYVLFQMMCGEVAPPSEDVPALDKSPGNTVREKFEAHEKDPKCAGCHKILDPPGLTLELYDAIGGYRTKDGQYDINAKVDLILSDGTKKTVDNPIQMAKWISTSDGYAQCVSKALYSYALGRNAAKTDGGGDMDEAVLEGLKTKLKDSGWKFQDVVKQIVSADTFRMRRANKGVMQ